MNDQEKKAAKAILRVFKQRKLDAGDVIQFGDFGGVLHWEAGFMKHEFQRNAMQELIERGFVIETNAGLELTAKGAASLEKV